MIESIGRGIANANAVICLISHSLLKSESCLHEAQLALMDKPLKIILILLEDISNVEDIPQPIKNMLKCRTYITWKDDEKFWETLERAIRR